MFQQYVFVPNGQYPRVPESDPNKDRSCLLVEAVLEIVQTLFSVWRPVFAAYRIRYVPRFESIAR